MNRVPSTERKTPQLRGVVRESVSCLGRQTESGLKELSHLIPSKVNSKLRVRSKIPIPVKGIAVMNPSRGHRSALNDPRQADS